MKNFFFFFLLIILSNSVSAQQDAQYTQYMYNTVTVNPAYAGSRDALSIIGLHRSQWVGLDGAPVTQTLSLHSPVGLKKKVGLGLSVINDKIGEGVSQETNFHGLFSYILKTSTKGKFSFGVNAGVSMLNVDFTKLTQLDQEFDGTNNIDNKFSPVVGVGFYYYSERFYAGISVPNLLETRHFDYSSGSASTVAYIGNEQMNFYLIAGHVFDIDENWEFKPAVLTKVVFGTPLQLDISANFWYKKKLTLGAAYRWDAAYSLMAGFNVSKSIMIGLAYDKEVTELGNTLYNDGSFEIVIRAELFKRFYKDCTCLRFF